MHHADQSKGHRDGEMEDVLVAPASFAQERLWFLQRYAPDSPQYNVPLAYRLRGDLSAAALQGSLDALVQRHETLRTTFALADTGVEQRVAPSGTWPFQTFDISHIPAHARESEALNRAAEEARRPFNLAAGPLARAALIRFAPRDHLLVLVVHHIVFDEWSQQVLARELGIFYNGLASGQEPTLDDLPIGYADFAAWQRGSLQGQALDESLSFWSAHLAGAPPHLDLPADRPRPAQETYRGACVAADLGAPIARAIDSVARLEQATPFMAHLAAFATVLHRYIGADDIIVGTPIANRGHKELEGLIGFFINTLAIRIRLDGDPTFRHLLRGVRKTALDAYAHQDAPFEKVVDALAPQRDTSRLPVFQVLFATRESVGGCPSLLGIDVDPVEIHTGTSKFDITAWIDRRPDGLRLRAEYSTDLFDARRIRGLLDHWRVLLGGIADHPDSRLSALPILTEEEQSRLEARAHGKPEPRDGPCIPQLFEAAAARWPQRIAVSSGDTTVTFAELNRRANAVARRLTAEGAAPDAPVGLFAHRSIEALAGVLGILKAGSPYVPIDPSLPAERIRLLIDDSGCQLILASPDSSPLPPGTRVLPLAAASQDPCSDDPATPARPDHLAYIIYTSGSTGRPKGVAMEHGPLSNLIAWQSGQPPEHAMKTLQFASLGFDVSFQECFSTWLAGGELVLAPETARTDPKSLWHLVCRLRVQRLFLPVVMLRHLAEAAIGSPETRDARVSTIITAGESLRITQPIRTLFCTLADATLVNQYGPTESHVVTAFTLTGNPDDWPESPPIGSPIDNATVRLLDRHLLPVPAGIPGEICIGGPVLARGYWRRPDLTAERFVPDHFAGNPSARLFRTGDIARYRHDGQIEFLGRADDQMKIRGFRVEPAEIEAVLGSCEGVREVAVIGHGDPPDRSLVAFVVPGSALAPTPDTLRNHARKHLPEHMVPAAIEIIDRLPLGPNGKVDRRALAARPTTRPTATGCDPSPQNLLELRLLRIWRKLFDSDTIGREENFFHLGGHSLLAARLASDVEALIGRPMPVPVLFHAPTVAALAHALREKDWTPPWSSLVPLQPSGDKPPFFFVHGWGGDMLGFVGLARLLGPDQPSYGLQAVGLDGRKPRHTSVEEMAAHYVREIRSFLPRGPYFIGSHSMGGVIAYEMARLLDRAGHRPGMVALIDTHSTFAVPRLLYLRLVLPYLIGRVWHHRRTFDKLRPGERRAFISGRLRALASLLFPRRADPDSLRAAASPETTNPRVSGFGDYYHAVATCYRPKPYAGKVHLFLSDNARIHSTSVWRHLARGGTVTHRVPGHHNEILDRDHVADFAMIFRDALDDAQRTAGDAPATP